MPPVGASQPTAEHARPFSHARRLSEDDRAELERLDRAVARMQKHTRPDPYIVTIAQDKDLRYQYQWRSQQYQWLHNTPFRYEEGEGIQYQTFVFQEPGTNMLSLHAQHYPEERPGTADSTRNATGSNTPAQGPKKVISFGAYKKKQSGETPAQESLGSRTADKSGKQPAVKGPAERVKELEAESADMIKAVEEDEKLEVNRDLLSQKDTPRDKDAIRKQPELKRKREEHTATSRDKDKAIEPNGHHSPPLPKKSRTEASMPASKEKRRPGSPAAAHAKRASNKEDVHTDTHMPPKLSPLRIEPHASDFFELPPRLSPELPANIDAALKATDAKRAPNRKHDDRKDGRRALGTKAPATSSHKSPQIHDNHRPRSRSPRSSANHRSTEAEPLYSPSDSHDVITVKKRRTLIVKLKFRKARKEDVHRILKLPARPDKHATLPSATPESSDDEDDSESSSSRKVAASKPAERRDDARQAGKGVAHKVTPLTKRVEDKRPTAEKRPRADTKADALDDVEPPIKKKRVEDAASEQPTKKKQGDSALSQQPSTKKQAPNALDLKKAPSTPVPPAVPSPAVSSAQKVTPATRRDLLHPRRDASADSQTETPPALSNTPSEQKRGSQQNGTTSRPPSSNPHAKPATPQAWEAERMHLERLGRDLKHGASDLLNNKPSSIARRIAAAKSVESLISYLLAFTCSDRAAIVANQNVPLRPWRSLPPFCAFVSRATSDFGTLSGLTSSLIVVVHARILDIASQYPTEGPSRDSLMELSGALRKAAVHAEENLDVDALIRAFPKSWAGRSKTSLASSPTDFGEPKKLLQGGYRLPLGVQTDPLQAARAGLALLKEWTTKEGLDYDYKLVA